MDRDEMVTLTADIAAAFLSNNDVAISDLPLVMQKLYDSLNGLGSEMEATTIENVPMIPVRASVKPDHISCLICGKKPRRCGAISPSRTGLRGRLPRKIQASRLLPDGRPGLFRKKSEACKANRIRDQGQICKKISVNGR